ncbi:hypothetical protein ScPMuIL_017314 [Solemya velum]
MYGTRSNQQDAANTEYGELLREISAKLSELISKFDGLGGAISDITTVSENQKRCLCVALLVVVAAVSSYSPLAEANMYRNKDWTDEDWAAADVCFQKRYGCQEICYFLKDCIRNCNNGFLDCVNLTKNKSTPQGSWSTPRESSSTPRATCKDKLFGCNRRCPHPHLPTCMRNCSGDVDRCLLLISWRVNKRKM